ncbi:MAG: alpha-2-macroglobulin [Reichenbachiella sp.]|uniref:alpha-2-macroglobulin n=1 Tax=Reichenbachiella sp. TaxID=2184521 RepID=UPI0032651AD6
MIKFDQATKEKAIKFFKSRPTKIAGITIGVLLLVFVIILFVKAPAKREKKITFTVSGPSAPDLSNQEYIPTIGIRFNGSVSKIEDVQSQIPQGISISPEVEGVWRWAADNRISFEPVQHWSPGTEYEIKMEKDLFPDHILLKQYEGSFKTQSFRISIGSSQFHIDPVDENVKQVIATINFSHPVNPEEFEGKVSLKPYKLDDEVQAFQDQEYEFSVTYDDVYSQAYIVSESLPIPEDDVSMRIAIEEGIQSAWKGNTHASPLTTDVVVPGMFNFVRVQSVEQTLVRNEKYVSEQVIVVDTKGKISASELQKNMEVLMLPIDRPEAPGIEASKNHYWNDVTKIGPEVRKLSVPIELKAMQTEHDYGAINSYKMKAPPARHIYVKIKKGTQFYGKYFLSKDYESIVKLKDFPVDLEIMHDGIILSSTGEKKISIVSQGVERVGFEIGRVLPDQINHLITQSNGDLTNLNFRNRLFSEDNIVESFYEGRNLGSIDPSESDFFSFDFSKYLDRDAQGKRKNGIFFFKVKSERTYGNRSGNRSDKRLIIVSDLGILVKESANQNRDLFVQSIKTGLSVANARVQVLGKNGIPILSAYTDIDGHVSFPTLNSFRYEKSPVAFVVTKGDDLSFLPVKASGRWLNYSKFDVGGVHGASDPKKLNAYLFSERGIYRPGDEFNIGMIVKAGDWRKRLENTPLEASIVDPRGLEIFKKKFKLNSSGFEEIKYITENSSPTGVYQINLYTINNERRYHSIGSTTVSVEEFQPDRLTISSVFTGRGDKAWISPKDINVQVSLRNLFGSPASGNRIASRITFSPGRMRFPAYRDFRFHDPLTARISYSETLPDQTTDEQGKAIFDLNLERFDAATYNLRFVADGFEKESGRNVTTQSSVLVSSLNYMIGTRTNGDLSYIYKNSERSVKFIAINADSEKTAVSDLQFIVNRIDQVSVLTKMPNGIYAYKSVSKRIPISSTTKNIQATGLDFALPTDEPGEYELITKDTDGVELSKLGFSVVGVGNITRSLDKTAELDIKLNKSDFNPGEEIEIFVKAPYKGAGIITIEKDKVYYSKWFKSETNSFLIKIKVPNGLEGNGYVNVAFVRAADSKNIYMTPLSYGIAPFAISKKNRINAITLDVPAKARSGEVFPIKFKTEKPAKIAIFAVDEGILQVANYQTPDPLAHFFKKSALEVKTSQLLDLILPEYSLSQNLSAMGGDAGMEEISKNLNPFKRKQHKPVVFWSGIVTTDQRERKLEYTVPDYFNGTLRVMAVAVSADAIGTVEKKSIVKNPFVISPNVPLYAAPSDSFQISVTVTNTLSGSGEKLPVNLEVVSSPHLTVHPASRRLTISEDKDTTIHFQVSVNKVLGGASLKFKASSSKEKASLASYLSVRPAIPYRTEVKTGTVRKEKVEVETPRRMYEEYRELNTSVSFLPLGLSNGLVQYLDKYPYGCTEQLVSQGFPYLLLKDVSGYEIDQKKLRDKISYTLKVLQARQNGEGKFGIWAANSHTSDFITVYGAHFITQCKNSGYAVSENLYDRTIEALKRIARNSDLEHMYEYRIQAYAIYILTMNEIVTTNYITSLRDELDDKFEDWEKDLTAGYMAGTYLMMQQEDEGRSLLSDVLGTNFFKRSITWNYHDGLVHNAQVLYICAKHAPDLLGNVSDEILQKIVGYLESDNYNTLNSSFSIMGISEFSRATNEPSAGKVSISQIISEKNSIPLKIPTGKFPEMDFAANTQKLLFVGEEDRTAYYQVVQAGFELELPDNNVKTEIEVSKTYQTLSGDNTQEATLGEEIEVHLKFRSINNRRLHDVAIIDLLPAGLEVDAASLRNELSGTWTPDYVDVREDRVVFYGTVDTQIQEMVYKVRAINKGDFIVPPLYGESMYDRTIYGYSPNERFTVK